MCLYVKWRECTSVCILSGESVGLSVVVEVVVAVGAGAVGAGSVGRGIEAKATLPNISEIAVNMATVEIIFFIKLLNFLTRSIIKKKFRNFLKCLIA